MNSSMYEQLLLNETVEVEGFGQIHNVTLGEVVDLGDQRFAQYIATLSIRKKDIEEVYKDEKYDDLNDFDMVLEIKDKTYNLNLIEAIRFFTKESNVVMHPEIQAITVGKHRLLDRDNYENFVNTIIAMTGRKKSDPDWVRYEGKSEEEIEKIKRKEYFRNRKAEKESLSFADMINIVKHGGSFLSKTEMRNMSYFEFIRYFEVILAQANYSDFIAFKTSANFKVEDKVQHWTKEIKINKE